MSNNKYLSVFFFTLDTKEVAIIAGSAGAILIFVLVLCLRKSCSTQDRTGTSNNVARSAIKTISIKRGPVINVPLKFSDNEHEDVYVIPSSLENKNYESLDPGDRNSDIVSDDGYEVPIIGKAEHIYKSVKEKHCVNGNDSEDKEVIYNDVADIQDPNEYEDVVNRKHLNNRNNDFDNPVEEVIYNNIAEPNNHEIASDGNEVVYNDIVSVQDGNRSKSVDGYVKAINHQHAASASPFQNGSSLLSNSQGEHPEPLFSVDNPEYMTPCLKPTEIDEPDVYVEFDK